MTCLTQRARRIAERPKKIGVSVWIPVTDEELREIDAAAARDRRNRGNWLLIAAQEKLQREPQPTA
jgi:DNA polymerase III delta prime subunit